MKSVIILRGLPGSGKSTWAKKMFPTAMIASADDYFKTPDGRYEFVPAKIATAHARCQSLALESIMMRPNETLVVDNTNTSAVEIAPYLSMVEIARYRGAHVRPRIIRLECTVEDSVERNIHGVPPHTIETMAERLSMPLPLWWPEEEVRSLG